MPKTRGNYFRWLYDDNIQIPDRTRYRYKAKERTIQPLTLVQRKGVSFLDQISLTTKGSRFLLLILHSF